MSDRRLPPIWLMGLSNAPLGFFSGIAFFAIPQILAAHHVSEARIAAITAAAISPTFWAVIFGPILDVFFSRRWYATVLFALAATCICTALLNINHLVILEIAMVLATVASLLGNTALGGWLSTICGTDQRNSISAWINIALISGTGVMAVAAGEILRHMPLLPAVSLLGAIIMLPTLIFLFMPAPGPDRRLAGESFTQFKREIFALIRRREVLIGLVLFISPCGSFALSNLLPGLGNDFHASPSMVSLAGGMGAIVPGVLGCLLFPLLAKRIPARFLYLAGGTVGGLYTLTLLLLPHAPWVFVLALVGAFLFQAFSFAAQAGIIFEVIGRNNPLAATTFTFLVAASNIPLTYMLVVDGRGYAWRGVAGSFIVDAAVSITACLVMGLVLFRLSGNAFGSGTEVAETIHILTEES